MQKDLRQKKEDNGFAVSIFLPQIFLLTHLKALAELDPHLGLEHQIPSSIEILVYGLGCAYGSLGREEQAVEWVRKAITLAGVEILERALDDPDLERIGGRLRTSGR